MYVICKCNTLCETYVIILIHITIYKYTYIRVEVKALSICTYINLNELV